MDSIIKKDLTELDKIVVGRVEPHIYAFSTNTIPNYLKIGDTYRPVAIRLNEWKNVYPELKKEYEEKAMVNDDVFFRDYSVHQFLESDLRKKRINPDDFPNETYVSNEFFKDTSVFDVQTAIDDIQKSYEEKLLKYRYYDATTSLETIEEYPSTGYWNMRPNQEEVVENFKLAISKGRNNLLMYAVMRFGKSFTAMCCALEMKAKIVLIVSAKADVKEEWKKTIQSADNFSNYKFLDSYNLHNENIIQTYLEQGNNVAIFLTLQDLQGRDIKERHKFLFDNNIDLLLIDETHFGARAESYGYVLRDIPDNREDGFIEYKEANTQLKVLKSKVRIHLSGTPYRILMGSEFSKDDIIAFCQFPDIVDAQQKWDYEHLNNEHYNEWDNPYYGFPQMIRFAFNPNESVRKKLEELKQNGFSYAFSELLRPMSIEKDSEGKHKIFKYENEVLDLLEVIDGSKNDENVLGFLNYDKIKQGKMCRHIVMVLPFCASCDCIETLINNNKEKFKNLCDYEIVNISGVDQTNIYRTVKDVKNKIKECENNDKKTLTLTVNRMLTGSTVEQWDTMIYLKDTASPQEYDQSIFRLQNQYVTEYVNLDTDDIIKYNKKPQTILVDFEPNRMFFMQETKSLIYNANIDKSGNSKLEERIRKELKISPIITLNKNKIHEVQPIDIMEAVSNYSKNRGVFEEVYELPVDLSLIDYPEILNVIKKQAKLGSKRGLKIYDDASQEEFVFDDDIKEQPDDVFGDETKEKKGITDTFGDDLIDNIKNDLASRFRTYYARILFFATLSKSNVSSLENIIEVIDIGENQRIAQNLGLEKDILSIINKNMDIFTLRQLDYKVQNINKLSNDTSMIELDRANTAINKFDKLSESEIITPQKICNEMIETIGINEIINIINQNKKILDLGSKKAEFILSIVNILKNNNIPLEKYKNNLYAIPTSPVAYEFTRRIYELLDLNINNIAEKFVATDLIKIRDRNNEIDYDKIRRYLSQDKEFNTIDLGDKLFVKEGEKNMKFDVIVGNPPYTEVIKKEVSTGSSKQLFPFFMMTSMELSDRFVSLITPSRWFVGGEQAGYFPKLRSYMKKNNHIKKLVHFTDYSDVFGGDVTIPGGVNYFLNDKKYTGNVNFVTISNGKEYTSNRKLFEDDLDIVLADYNLYSILSKVRNKEFESYMDIVGEWNSYGVVGQAKYLNPITVEKIFDNAIRVQCAYEKKRYIKYEDIPKKKDSIKKWKVFTSKGNGGAGTLQDGKPVNIIGKSFVAEPNSICTDSLIPIGCFDTEIEAINVRKYMATKFLRFMVGILKVSQNIYRNVYRFVPMQDFTNNSDIDWTKSIKDIDNQLYKKYDLSRDEINYIESKIKEMD